MHVTDARGSTINLFKPTPERIVSLVPSQTELLHHLGLETEVLGITKFCVHPEAWFRSKTRVGGTKKVNLNTVRRLKPDLVLANKEENEKEQIEALAAEVPVWVTDVANLQDALEMIAVIGTLTGKEQAAALLNTKIQDVFIQLAAVNVQQRFRTCYLIWNEPLISVGGDTFIHDMMEQVGFQNIFALEKRYPQVTLNMLQAARCELLLLSSEPYPFAEKHRAFFQSRLPLTKVVLADGEYFSWYGSRLLQAPDYFKNLQAQLNNFKTA
jgi:ABC-type Fe3+-hydroxamate transport system substrate-binding protein